MSLPEALFFGDYSQGIVAVGCLPLPVMLMLGFATGYLIDGRSGSLWGAGIGLVAGIAATAWFIRAMRRANR